MKAMKRNRVVLVVVLVGISVLASCARQSDEELMLESALEISMNARSGSVDEPLLLMIISHCVELDKYDRAFGLAEEMTTSSKSDFAYDMRDFAYKYISEGLARDGRFSEALETAKLIEDKERISDAMSDIAVAFADDGQFEVALIVTDSIPNTFLKAWALVEISMKYSDTGKLNEALKTLNKGYDIADGIADSMEKDHAFGRLAVAYMSLAEVDQANKALSLVREDGERAKTLLGMADVYLEGKDTTAALQVSEKAFEIVKKMQDKGDGDTQRLLAGVGLRYFKAGMHEEGIRIVRLIYGDILKIRNLSNLAVLYKEQRQIGESNKLLDEALEIAHEIEEPYYRSLALASFAKECAIAQGFVRANEALAEAMLTTEGIEKDYQRVMALETVAHGYIGTGEYEKALEICRRLDASRQAMTLLVLLGHQKESDQELSKKERRMIKEMVTSGEEESNKEE
jgi:tetratricopeptide (TPR) repeat protein